MTLASQPRSMLSLSYGDYLRFSKLVEDRFGLRFPEKRFADLEIGVRQAYAASTCTDLDEYYHRLLDSHDGSVEMDRLVNALTVNETYFLLYHRPLGLCWLPRSTHGRGEIAIRTCNRTRPLEG